MIMANTATAELGNEGIFKPSVSAMKAKPIDSPNAIVLEASLEMPFSPKVAYDAFSDFSRHADWNPGVTNVEYVDPLNRPHEARWTMEAFAGLKIDWHTVPTALVSWFACLQAMHVIGTLIKLFHFYRSQAGLLRGRVSRECSLKARCILPRWPMVGKP